jgi:hypothetical protein
VRGTLHTSMQWIKQDRDAKFTEDEIKQVAFRACTMVEKMRLLLAIHII